jgi:ribosomal protein S27E
MIQPTPGTQPPPNSSPASNARPVLRQISCPQCGAPVQQFNAGSQSIICKSCKSTIVLSGEEAQIIGNGGRMPAPPRPIPLGGRMTLEGTQYFVLGRVLYEGWDDEDRWRWTEWQLGSNDGRAVWLSFEENGFVLYRKLRLRTPFDPLKDRVFNVDAETKVTVTERYPARIVGAEGELTFRAVASSRLDMIEGVSSKKEKVSIQKTSTELEVYAGNPVPESAIAKYFGDASWEKEILKERAGKSRSASLAVLFFAFAMLGFLAALFSARSGVRVLSERVTLVQGAAAVQIPFQVNVDNRPMRLTTRLMNGLNTGQTVDVDYVVNTPDDAEILVLEGDFWAETGIDEGERWSESNYDGDQVFNPHVSGQYVLEVELGTSSLNRADVEITLWRDHIIGTYFLIYAVAMAVFGVLFFLGSMQTRK